MADNYDVIAIGGSYEKDGEEKNRFVRIGAAFPPGKDGKGWTLKLDALPISVDGQATLLIRKREEKKDTGGGF